MIPCCLMFDRQFFCSFSFEVYSYFSIQNITWSVGQILAPHSLVFVYSEWLRPGEENLVQRFDPSAPLDTIGFFIAKFAVGSKDTWQLCPRYSLDPCLFCEFPLQEAILVFKIGFWLQSPELHMRPFGNLLTVHWKIMIK